MTVNWYDFVILAMLVYGFVDGMRTGLRKKFVTFVANTATLALALSASPSIAGWLRHDERISNTVSMLIAYVAVSLAAYLWFLLVRLLLRGWTEQRTTGALENWGGGLFGTLSTFILVGSLSVSLLLTRSPFLYRQIAENSCFGVHVVHHISPFDLTPNSGNVRSLKNIQWKKKPRTYEKLDDSLR